MADYPIVPDSRHEWILTLLVGEILTRRGEPGPLARVFVPRVKMGAGKRQQSTAGREGGRGHGENGRGEKGQS